MMHTPATCALLLLAASAACSTSSSPQDAGVELSAIALSLEAGDTQAAFQELERLLDAGYPTPSDLLSDQRFRILRDDPAHRERLRDLLSDHARPAPIVMVDPSEPGMPLRFDLTVLDARSGHPLQGVHVLFTQVDDQGLYQPSDLDQKLISRNPRLFGFASTDPSGTVSARTIRPAHYHAHYDASEPAHIHFTLTMEGYRTWGGEILFEDDPRVDAEVRTEADRHGTPILKTTVAADGTLHASATVRLQQE